LPYDADPVVTGWLCWAAFRVAVAAAVIAAIVLLVA
jgi:hypothetical protein